MNAFRLIGSFLIGSILNGSLVTAELNCQRDEPDSHSDGPDDEDEGVGLHGQDFLGVIFKEEDVGVHHQLERHRMVGKVMNESS